MADPNDKDGERADTGDRMTTRKSEPGYLTE